MTTSDLEQRLNSLPKEDADIWHGGYVPSPDSGERQIRRNILGWESTEWHTLQSFCEQVEERVSRWREGRYAMAEVAVLIGQANPKIDAEKLLKQMDEAARSPRPGASPPEGRLKIRDNEIPKNPMQLRPGMRWETVSQNDVNEWLKEVGASYRLEFPYGEVEGRSSGENAAAKPMPMQQAQAGWHLNRPKRFQGYGLPLYTFLQAAHQAGKSRPTAADVVVEWTRSRPTGILRVKRDSLDFLDSAGNEKAADLRAITKTIGRLTKKPAQ